METPRGGCSRQNRSRYGSLRPLLFLVLALTGLAAPSAAQLSPGGPFDFGSAPVGTTGTPQTLPLLASVNTAVTSVVATTDGAIGKDFNVTSQSCVPLVTPSAPCQITITFTPSAIGLRRGELLIYNGAAVIYRAALHGNGLGPQLVLSPSAAVATTSLSGITPAAISPSSTVFDGNGDLFIDDGSNGRILEQAGGTGPAAVVATFPADPHSFITIAGDGILYFTSPTTGQVYALPSSGGTATPYSTGSATLSNPTGIATDGWGFLYIVDSANNRIVYVNLDAGSPNGTVLAFTGLGTPLANPIGLAIDGSRNAYLADSGNNRAVEVSLKTDTASVFPISGATLSAPTGLAVNAAGGLTLADTGNSRLLEAPASGAAFPLVLTGATLTTPIGVTLLPTGDLLVSDTVAGLVQITRSSASLTFPTSTLVGTIDTTDGDLAVTAENTGSYVLQIPSGNPANLGAFFADSTSTCPVTTSGTPSSTQIGIGDVCTYEFGFKPTQKGTNSTVATITATAVSGGSSPIPSTVTPTVSLTGTGYVQLAYFTLTISPSPLAPGQPATVTVTAYNNDGSVDTGYTGTITLSSTDPAANLPATVTFTAADNGVAVIPVTFNTLGTWTITAVDTVTIPGQTITGTSNTVTVQATPTVTLTSSVNPVNVNANTTLTVTVTSPFGTPSGTVTIMDGSATLGTVTLTNGAGTLTVSFSTPGQHTLTAVYPGAGFFLPATSAPLIETVQQFTTSVTLTSSVNPVMIGSSTTLTATVTSTLGTPPGSITFMDGSTVLGTVTLNAAGVATLSVTFTTTGQHTLTAVYPGSSPYTGATSAPVIENVGDFSLSLASTSTPSVSIILGGSATFNLIVAPVGTATLAGPVALNVTGLPSNMPATLAPSTVAAGSGSTPVVLTVTAPPLNTSSQSMRSHGPASWQHAAPAFFALLLLPLGALTRRRKPLARLLLLLIGLGIASTGLTGCLSDATTGYYAEPPQTYTLTVSGTSGSLVHSLLLTVTVE